MAVLVVVYAKTSPPQFSLSRFYLKEEAICKIGKLGAEAVINRNTLNEAPDGFLLPCLL